MAQPDLHIWMWAFYHTFYEWEFTQLVSGFLSEVIAPSIAVHSVHLWSEGSSGVTCDAS